MDTTRILKKESPTLWIFDRKNNNPNPWKKVELTLEDLFNKNLLEKSDVQNLVLLEKDSLLIIKGSPNLKQELVRLEIPDWLSPDQQEEMTSYMTRLLSQQYSKTHRGPITRANEWFSSKLQSRKAFKIEFGEWIRI